MKLRRLDTRNRRESVSRPRIGRRRRDRRRRPVRVHIEAAPEPLRAVRTAEIRYDKTQETNRYVGTVQSRHEVNEAFRVGGKVVQRKVDVGQKVREGDVLAVLDDTDYRLAEEAARQQLDAATTQARQAESDRQRLNALEDATARSARPTTRRRRRGAQTASRHGGGRGEEARACTQSAEVHGAARVAERRRHRACASRSDRSWPKASRSSRSPTKASPRSWPTCPRITWRHSRASRYKAWLASAPEQTFEVVLRELSPQAAAQTRTFRARLKPRDAAAAAARRDRHARRRTPGRRSAGSGNPRLRDHAEQGPARGLGRSSRGGRAGRNRRSHQRRRCTAIATTRCSCPGRRPGELVVTAGVQKMAPGLRVALPGDRAQRRNEAGRPMKSFNLTEWALNHRAIVLFLILAIGIGGVLGFTKLGQLEDPNFSVPSMTAIVYLARRDRATDPGRGAQPHGEEVRAARPLREGQDVSRARATAA